MKISFPPWGLQGIHIPSAVSETSSKGSALSASASPFHPSSAPRKASAAAAPGCLVAEPDLCPRRAPPSDRVDDPMRWEARFDVSPAGGQRPQHADIPVRRVFERLTSFLRPPCDSVSGPNGLDDVTVPAPDESPAEAATASVGLPDHVVSASDGPGFSAPSSPPRGSLSEVVVPGSSPDVRGANETDGVAAFCNAITRSPPPPVLATKPPRRRSKVTAPDFQLRRSSRLAAKSKNRGPNPITVEQNIIMCRPGLVAQDSAPDTAAFQEHVRLFAEGLSDDHCLALRELFGGRVDWSSQASILEDEEFVAAA